MNRKPAHDRLSTDMQQICTERLGIRGETSLAFLMTLSILKKATQNSFQHLPRRRKGAGMAQW